MKEYAIFNGNTDSRRKRRCTDQRSHGRSKRAWGKVHLIHIREKRIGFCRACYGCSQTGVCVQKDDFMDILRLAHEADAIIAEAPIYYITVWQRR